ncbi:unnamed protein product [Sphenostylis stenocarpa]|uniref:PGG domain-containing protein n=1 Tax=Sphenostylis stenocarpa TaxID=92480 RepID=A0AA86W573_9FABA|nr:unnamed protein product [Sphenostylis stenocarpa]
MASNFKVTSDNNLKEAAPDGDLNLLYTLIEEDPQVLEHEDSIPFVETPLHTAALFGNVGFATEIMRLKPSFAWKLNQQGFTPIHLAMQHNHKKMVLRFVNVNKELVRAKGREGFTPLHFASQIGEIDLLANFLMACPDSIEDVSVRCETALHVAVKYQQYEALLVLVGWLKRTCHTSAMEIEETILNWKDESGNTILHVSALNNDSKALRLLVKTKIDLKAKNLENSTALDMVQRQSKFAALIATATYQSALSPPGGVYQANAEKNVNTAGSSVMTECDFLTLSISNSLSLMLSTATIYILTPSGIVGNVLFIPMFWFAYCYLYSMKVISPTGASSIVNLFMLCLFVFLPSGVRWAFSKAYKRLKRRENREIETRDGTSGRNLC